MSIAETLAPGATGLDQLHAMIAAGGVAPIGKTIGMRLVEAGDGFAAFVGLPSADVYNPIGTVHGGFAATLLDSACGCAAHSKISATQGYTTLELKVAYHKAITAKTGEVRAEGRILSFGRRAAFTEATLKDGGGRLLASATSTLLIFERSSPA